MNTPIVRQIQTSSKSAALQLHKNQLRLLKYSLINIMQMEEYNILKNGISSPHSMVSTIGLNGIARKFDSYANVDEFLADIKALVRSYYIHFGTEGGVKHVINRLSELCHRDVKSIRTCPECFENWATDHDNYFVKVCTKPHLIIFSKGTHFPYWPAKLMSITGAMANVVFFGDHTQDDVPVTQCILYAQRNPIQSAQTDEFNNALMELNVHIRNVVEKFGSFNPTESKVMLNAQMLEQSLMSMFPGAYKQRFIVRSMGFQHDTNQFAGPSPLGPSSSNDVPKAIHLKALPKSVHVNRADANSDESKAKAGQLKRKRGAPPSVSQVESMPTQTISRSIIGDDVKMHFEALSRRIVELEDEKTRLAQQLTVLKEQSNAKIKKKNDKIRNLKRMADFIQCGHCRERIPSPVFCDRRCESLYEPDDNYSIREKDTSDSDSD
ncbi:protein kinase C-binding protein 1-like isoform X2 [Contarinia nasturtii]|uniref:protein kinase C-binding protein 1-like isoform X2 n=1 Tax=Contarinia nasturtii TaxID=265458 RepID=UPI0012D47549|nr:protein kinase C-binding protein 1-like isoform X2 [Contarinia nasturtii]